MEILTPDIGLIFWTLFFILSLIVLVVAAIALVRNKNLDSYTKLMWALIIIFIPAIGSIIFLTIGRKKGKA